MRRLKTGLRGINERRIWRAQGEVKVGLRKMTEKEMEEYFGLIIDVEVSGAMSDADLDRWLENTKDYEITYSNFQSDVDWGYLLTMARQKRDDLSGDRIGE